MFLMMPSITAFFNLMAFACAACYIISVISSIKMQKEHPEWKRPYKLPGGNLMRYLALVISMVIAGFTAYGQTTESWFGFIGYMGIGLVLWIWMMVKKWPEERVWMMTPDGEKEF